MDGLITNFHLPESTLLMLVSALAGKKRVMAAYDEAVQERYRFFSFGDAMHLITNRLIYNPDGSYNERFYEKDGALKCSLEELNQAQEEYRVMIKEKGLHIAWDEFHTSDWNHEICDAWCKEHSANHRF